MSAKHGAHSLEREDFGPVSVVRLKTMHVKDDDAIRDIFDLIYKLVTEVGRHQLIINLAQADFLPSMGLGKLVMLNRKIQSAKGRLALCDLDEIVLESLEHTHLVSLFNIYPSETEALKSFVEGGPSEQTS